MNRRECLAGVAALCLSARLHAQARKARAIDLIEAPSNLGLRPHPDGSLAGTWRAPEALRQAGLEQAIVIRNRVALPRPAYEREAQQGTRIRNGQSIRTFNLALAEAVGRSLTNEGFPLLGDPENSDLTSHHATDQTAGNHCDSRTS